MQIGTKTKDNIVKTIDGLIADFLPDIDRAYGLAEDVFTLSIPVKIKPASKSGIEVEVGISFSTGKIKARKKMFLDENQMELPLK
jgi:hypothetical protein